MAVPHLVLSGADEYLARGDGDSLRVFETRVEDSIGHVPAEKKLALIEEIAAELRGRSAGGGVQVLLDFLGRQRRVVRGEL